ncbi:MAG: type I-E CRISPR-associated protein Cas7/Cse4/CasC [Methylobacter sp.]|nr:type I-E CRISPR-associated protein Cas7/Cse4/CasC [Methylobacter sp.]MDP2430211.1 type I-E CRISPR-associated protein Cas7/Cse4/CasC [Methylobacter sp.]MDP3053299.1 type I-E CRISPR-associated protein Cas7/Cse4/CasC [Methylobacter sp.]MDP3361959.1 type I-E CRISPR-associated protein Cas7/Cse4/CasC [Methylobacter sp.]MDZ4219090.1 type I-E CRISPR-associated protein Cas7/Cse4/CasC [Methylobacter sp.]
MEAAAQVAHAITVHAVKVDDDYFTAVDDLNKHDEDAGAAHIGETGFASGVFYLYVCINKTLLCENLQNDSELVNKTLAAFIESMTKVSPTGKQNSFASRAYTSYLLAEKGTQQPRSLSVAFLKPVQGSDLLNDAIKNLNAQYENFDHVYGKCADDRKSCLVTTEKSEGSLSEIIGFLTAGEPCSNT